MVKQSKYMKDMIGAKQYVDAWKRLYNDSVLLAATIVVNTDGMISTGWQLTRINQGWSMTRVEGNGIAIRDLTLWEKIKYYKKTKRFIEHSKLCNAKEPSLWR